MKPLHALPWLALLLAGCASSPPPAVPPPPLPDRYAGSAATASPVLEADWWKRFNEPVLDALVERALAANLDLRAAALRVDEAAVALGLARATQWPSVDFGAGVSRSRSSTLTGQPVSPNGPESTSHRLSLSTSFEVDLWGRLRDATAAAQAQLLSTQHARDTVRLALVGTLVQSWLALRALDQQTATLDAQLKLRVDSLSLVQRRVKGGVASGLDEAQAQAALAALAAQTHELARQRSLLEHQIAQLVGDPAWTAARDARALPPPAAVPAGLPSELLLRRPDLQQAEAAMRAAFAQYEVTRKSAWPTLSLTASAGAQSAELLDIVKAGARVWSLGPQLLVSVFDAGRNQARTDEARLQAEQAVIGWQKSAQTAFREVADALGSGGALAAQESELERQRSAALEAQRIATRRYEAGYAGYLEVLDAQRVASDAELALLRVRQARLDASVALIKALGGGWRAAT
ncbi:MAG: efflux transporter outer membrane subunit [Rubrivivax sp.]